MAKTALLGMLCSSNMISIYVLTSSMLKKHDLIILICVSTGPFFHTRVLVEVPTTLSFYHARFSSLDSGTNNFVLLTMFTHNDEGMGLRAVEVQKELGF